MVVGTNGYELRDESFWLDTAQGFWDMVDADWDVVQDIKVCVSKHVVDVDDPSVFIGFRVEYGVGSHGGFALASGMVMAYAVGPQRLL
ncbi:hypothetical protein L6164_006244 [Bauhinia variegata]|uniref:Uncharacterized protein n=1 Tax=Bauhinia variegata TaxID=167791 RepID=A0ACB9PWH5_BAUVA|nr:hypothetical protein L6164_006244 [Bauhinia variegata]